MSTEPGLGALVFLSPRGWIICQSHLTCSTLVSTPASSIHSWEGSWQPPLGAQEACSWQRSCCGMAPGDEIPLSTPCTPSEERGLPTLPALTMAVPSALFHSPSQSLLQYSWWVATGPAPTGSLEGENPLALLLLCGGRGAGTVAGQHHVGGTDRGESPPLGTVCSLSVPHVSKYLYGFFLRGGGIYVSSVPESWFKPLNPINSVTDSVFLSLWWGQLCTTCRRELEGTQWGRKLCTQEWIHCQAGTPLLGWKLWKSILPCWCKAFTLKARSL